MSNSPSNPTANIVQAYKDASKEALRCLDEALEAFDKAQAAGTGNARTVFENKQAAALTAFQNWFTAAEHAKTIMKNFP